MAFRLAFLDFASLDPQSRDGKDFRLPAFVATLLLCCCGMEAPWPASEWGWLRANKTLFTDRGFVPDGAHSCHPLPTGMVKLQIEACYQDPLYLVEPDLWEDISQRSSMSSGAVPLFSCPLS